MDLIARQESPGLVGIDGEHGEESRRPVTVDGEREGNSVDQREPPRLKLEPFRNRHRAPSVWLVELGQDDRKRVLSRLLPQEDVEMPVRRQNVQGTAILGVPGKVIV